MFVETKREGEIETKPIEAWRRLLLDAANEVERRGHTKHALMNHAGCVCAGGAIIAALDPTMHIRKEPGWSCPVYSFKDGQGDTFTQAVEALKKHIGPAWHSIPHWNNMPERTGSEVVTAMRACANS